MQGQELKIKVRRVPPSNVGAFPLQIKEYPSRLGRPESWDRHYAVDEAERKQQPIHQNKTILLIVDSLYPSKSGTFQNKAKKKE